MLKLSRERRLSEFVSRTIAWCMGLGHAMESYIVIRRLRSCALTDCSGPVPAGRDVTKQPLQPNSSQAIADVASN